MKASGARTVQHVSFVLLAEFDIDQGSILSHQYPYPTGINDGYDALKWVSHDSCAAYIPIANLLVV